jgi:hypothetical protein
MKVLPNISLIFPNQSRLITEEDFSLSDQMERAAAMNDTMSLLQ